MSSDAQTAVGAGPARLWHESQKENQIDEREHDETYPVDCFGERSSFVQIGRLRVHLFGFAKDMAVCRQILSTTNEFQCRQQKIAQVLQWNPYLRTQGCLLRIGWCGSLKTFFLVTD